MSGWTEDRVASLWYTVSQPPGALRREGPALDSPELLPSLPYGTLLGCRNRRMVGDTERVELVLRCAQKPLGLVASDVRGWVSTKVLAHAQAPASLFAPDMRPLPVELFNPRKLAAKQDPAARRAYDRQRLEAAKQKERRVRAAELPRKVESESEDEPEREHCHCWVVEKKWALVRSDVGTDSAHLADVRQGRLLFTSSRRVTETGNVRLRVVAPLEGWVSEKVLAPFRFAKRWRLSARCLDCRNVIDVRSAGKKGMAVYVKRTIPSVLRRLRRFAAAVTAVA